MKSPLKEYTATRNACKLCAPLGASMAFKGIQGCVPIIHGSQGCATYVRRYMISHFREPVDIASSNFSEESTIFGGGDNLKKALYNVGSQYEPKHIGISTTCLSETIGDDVPQIIKDFRKDHPHFDTLGLAHASTPSYCGSHVDGFHQAVVSVIDGLTCEAEKNDKIVFLPGMLSPADYRYFIEMFKEMDQSVIMLPDLSETLDNAHWNDYKRIPDGGTTLTQLAEVGGAKTFIQLGDVLNNGMKTNAIKKRKTTSPASSLKKKFDMDGHQVTFPIGINATDRLFKTLKDVTGKEMPEKYAMERGRLIDAYTDGHKYVFDKQAVVYGEEDFVIGMTEFLMEIGVRPILIATGGKSSVFEDIIREKLLPGHDPVIMTGADFEQIEEQCQNLKPDFMIGHSKGYYITRAKKIPLIRVGFPIHDRLGGQRVLHVGYEGAHRLFELIANALLEYKQETSAVGYKYF